MSKLLGYVLCFFFCLESGIASNKDSDENGMQDNKDKVTAVDVERDGENRTESNLSLLEAGRTSSLAGSNAMLRSTSVYIPTAIDVKGYLEKEARCCFCVARLVLQPFNIILPLAATALIAAGEYFEGKDQKTARALNVGELICSSCGFITSVLLLKVNNKIEKTDKHLQGGDEQ